MRELDDLIEALPGLLSGPMVGQIIEDWPFSENRKEELRQLGRALAEETVQKYRDLKTSPSSISYIRPRMRELGRKWDAAVKKLEEAQKKGSDTKKQQEKIQESKETYFKCYTEYWKYYAEFEKAERLYIRTRGDLEKQYDGITPWHRLPNPNFPQALLDDLKESSPFDVIVSMRILAMAVIADRVERLIDEFPLTTQEERQLYQGLGQVLEDELSGLHRKFDIIEEHSEKEENRHGSAPNAGGWRGVLSRMRGYAEEKLRDAGGYVERYAADPAYRGYLGLHTLMKIELMGALAIEGFEADIKRQRAETQGLEPESFTRLSPLGTVLTVSRDRYIRDWWELEPKKKLSVTLALASNFAVGL